MTTSNAANCSHCGKRTNKNLLYVVKGHVGKVCRACLTSVAG